MDIVSERTVYEWGIIMTKKKSHTEHSVQLAIWQYFRREMLRLALIGIPLLYCGLLIVLFVIDNVVAKHLGEFLLGVVKVCVFMAAMTGTVTVSAFVTVQGTFVILDKYGFRGIVIELIIVVMALVLASETFQDKREQNKAQRTRNEAQTESDQRALENKKTNRD